MSDLSLKAAHDRRLDLEAKANRIWDEYVKRLKKLIPESLIPFARWLRWIENKNDPHSLLPEFFLNLVKTTMAGDHITIVVYSQNLKHFEFSNFTMFEEALQKLNLAWKNVVRTEVVKNELPGHGQIEIRFFATEYELGRN